MKTQLTSIAPRNDGEVGWVVALICVALPASQRTVGIYTTLNDKWYVKQRPAVSLTVRAIPSSWLRLTLCVQRRIRRNPDVLIIACQLDRQLDCSQLCYPSAEFPPPQSRNQ
jgi:hypothetical protein